MSFIPFAFLVLQISSVHSSIYGIDDRIESFQNKNSHLSKVISSTAAMIANDFITLSNSNTVEIIAPFFKDIYRLCPTERFRDQITAASCSGTLIDKGIMLTAGHCFAEAGLDCKGHSWVFDYRLNNYGPNKFILPRSSVYKCKQILKKVEDKKHNIDYALIRLDRDVLDRLPVNLRLTGDVEQKSKMAAIGHPRGLPTKISQHGDVIEILPDFFRTNLDTYTINSGSGVFNEATGELEGVLISGAKDFNFSNEKNCNQSTIYQQTEGSELVMKIKTIIPDLNLF